MVLFLNLLTWSIWFTRVNTNRYEDKICRTLSVWRRIEGRNPEGSNQWYLVGRELAARSLRGARSHRNGCNGKCKGMAADNILKRARVCCGQSSLAGVALAQCWREHDEESAKRRAGGGCEGERGLYVKGGRARCYLACSPDEISASSFRPSFPLLPRSSPLSLPSSYAFFLFCLCSSALSPAYRISLHRSCKVKTFSVCAIVRLLIALGFPLPSPFSFLLIQICLFSMTFLFFHTSYFSYIF